MSDAFICFFFIILFSSDISIYSFVTNVSFTCAGCGSSCFIKCLSCRCRTNKQKKTWWSGNSPIMFDCSFYCVCMWPLMKLGLFKSLHKLHIPIAYLKSVGHISIYGVKVAYLSRFYVHFLYVKAWHKLTALSFVWQTYTNMLICRN